MKLAFWALLLPIFASAASFDGKADGEEDSGDDEIYLVPQEVNIWEYVQDDGTKSIGDENVLEIETSSPVSWSIFSFFNSFLTSSVTPIKKSSSAPDLDVLQTSLKDSDATYIASILNCETSDLRGFDISSLQRVVLFKDLKKSDLLSALADLGDRALFEMFFDRNLALILTEINCSRDFHNVVFSCIKIKSMNCFFNAVHNRSCKHALNAPQAIVVASMFGCADILQYVLDNQRSSDYLWEWKHFDDGNGFMLKFGTDPFSASLFLGSIKTIFGGHLVCLNILIANGLDVAYNSYLLLKEIAPYCNVKIFQRIYSHAEFRIPIPVMKEILFTAISGGNEQLVEFILSLKLKLNINSEEHLSAALISKNENVVNMILSQITLGSIDSKILILAASLENENNFIAILKISKSEIVLSSLCSCIKTPNHQHYVPNIISEIQLNTEMISLALVYSVKAGSQYFVSILLRHKNCNNIAVKPGFTEALYSNNVGIMNEFFVCDKFDRTSLIRSKDISSRLDTMFDLKSWDTLKLFTEKFYDNSEFSKHKFVAMISETDQVDIVKFIIKKDAPFSRSTLSHVTNAEIHNLISNYIAKNEKMQKQNRIIY